jgi:GNAT superfamily N-acetyltransferase
MLIKNFSEEFLQSVAKLCRQNMVYDIMPDFLLREKTFEDIDYNPELTLVSFIPGSQLPAGFIQAVVRRRDTGKVGYIKLLCVDSNERRKGIASDLYRKIEEKFKINDVKVIRIYESYPNYFMPGVDPFYTEAVCFFEKKGFKKFGDTSNLSADLLEQNFSTSLDEEKLEQADIVIRRADKKDSEKVFRFIDNIFPAWHSEVSEAFKNNPISLFIALFNGEVKAFSAYEGNNRGTGWFGPMGTDNSFRGKGIGSVLLKKCLADMKEIGFVKAVIPWVGPIPFYMNYANAKVERVFWRYEKILE